MLHKHKLDLYRWNPLKLQSILLVKCEFVLVWGLTRFSLALAFRYFAEVYMVTTYMWWVLSVQFSLDKCLPLYNPHACQDTANYYHSREFPCSPSQAFSSLETGLVSLMLPSVILEFILVSYLENLLSDWHRLMFSTCDS